MARKVSGHTENGMHRHGGSKPVLAKCSMKGKGKGMKKGSFKKA